MAKLAAYRAKRDFARTPEPQGVDGEAGGFAFVVQKHAARRLHYDLRLELDGVMKSWAVAKGPSLVPGEKRLAVHVEDHPLAYNTFEGTIPKGQYGGGTVLVWDRGRWIPNEDPHKGYRKGHLDFTLEGEKLRGKWHLVRIRAKAGEKGEPWLLIKSDDTAARHAGDADILDEEPLSVATGRDLEAVASAPDGPVWDSNVGLAAEERSSGASGKRRRDVPTRAKPKRRRRGEDMSPETTGPDHPARAVSPAAPSAKSGRPAAMPKSVEPCLATLVSHVPTGERWLHEIKWDGYRLIALKAKGRVRLLTRRGLDWTARFPAIAAAIAALPVDEVVLDGEAVIEDESGVSSFSALQNALSDEHGRIARDAVLIAFDLLHLDGHGLRDLPLEDRKARLADLIPPGTAGALRLGEHIDGEGPAMVRSACRLGLEGVISKRRDRPYRSGRSDDWVKVKCTQRQEFVIVGFTDSAATRRAVGSLVLAYNEAGSLRLAGRAGTGFTAASARETWTRLEPLARRTPPVSTRPTAEERRGVTWVEPRLVAEIEFRGWTGDGHLRQAAFKGMRDDKEPEEVVRERPADEPLPASAEAGPAPSASRRSRGDTAEVAGVALTHPDRILWEEGPLTKQDLAAYYEQVAAWLLPHLVRRPLSLVRCPGGADKGCFFQKHSWAGLGDTIRREMVRDEGGEEEILFLEDLGGVVSLVQASVLEIHPWGATIDDVERADRITIDLDPGEGVAFAQVAASAREVRERLARDGLESFLKTTGGKGLHVVVPLSGPAPWDKVKAYAKSIADAMASDTPDRYLAKASKSARRGLIYVDYLRNGRGATAVSAYSTRARPGAPVSTPLAWSELTSALDPSRLTLGSLPARLRRQKADPWAEIGRLRQPLPAITARTTGPRGRR